MALKIRLARAGSKKRPYYHIVVSDVRAPRDGRFIERLGFWNPMLPKDAKRVSIDVEKARSWLEKGAQPTDRVSRFLNDAGLLERNPRKNLLKGQPGKKAQERIEIAKKKMGEQP